MIHWLIAVVLFQPNFGLSHSYIRSVLMFYVIVLAVMGLKCLLQVNEGVLV